MSQKDIVGSLERSLRCVPEEMRGTLRDLCHKLSGKNGRYYSEKLKGMLKQFPCVTSFDRSTGVFRFEVNYDESIAEKLATAKLRCVAKNLKDENLPDYRVGKKIVEARIFRLKDYARLSKIGIRQGETLVTPKELLDFLDNFWALPDFAMPHTLLAARQFWLDPEGNMHFFCFNTHRPDMSFTEYHNIDEIDLCGPDPLFNGGWAVLVILN